MFKKIKKVLLSLLAVLAVCFATGVFLLLNPGVLYAHKTEIGKFKIYHHQPLQEGIVETLAASLQIVEASELYKADKKLDICLGDGSKYPKIFEKLKGQGVGYSIMNKVILNADCYFKDNFAQWSWERNNFETRKWDLTELIAHEMAHVFQYYHQKTMPLKHPNWKIEGYAETVARKHRGTLKENVGHLLDAEKNGIGYWGWFTFEDETGIPISYLQNWVLVQYLMEIERLTFVEILEDDTLEEEVKKKMVQWYELENE